MHHLVLIDGHHMMYRAYWAIPRTMRTSTGEQVNTVFGMASMLLSILQQEEPDALLICFDAGEATFRHQQNETYKAGRSETPDDFYAQIPRIQELIAACNLPTVSDPQYEADDFLGAYACQAAAAGSRVTVVTGDRDAFQLASDQIRIAIPHKGYQATEYLGPADVLAKFGVTPQQVPAFKGLCGDSSDNLPGVRGIGPKTAAQLLQEYGTLGSIYEHLDAIKPVLAAKLAADREQAFFCERMAQLLTDLPLPLPLTALTLSAMPADSILTFFGALEFGLLTRRFQRFLETPYGREHCTIPSASSLPSSATHSVQSVAQPTLF
jgi:DNA polymerase I